MISRFNDEELDSILPSSSKGFLGFRSPLTEMLDDYYRILQNSGADVGKLYLRFVEFIFKSNNPSAMEKLHEFRRLASEFNWLVLQGEGAVWNMDSENRRYIENELNYLLDDVIRLNRKRKRDNESMDELEAERPLKFTHYINDAESHLFNRVTPKAKK